MVTSKIDTMKYFDQNCTSPNEENVSYSEQKNVEVMRQTRTSIDNASEPTLNDSLNDETEKCVLSRMCELNTNSNSMCRCAQCVKTHTDQIEHISSREHAWLKLEGSGLHIFVSPKQLSSTCHVSFRTAPDTDHKHKFSLTYFTYLSDCLTNTHKIFGTRSIFTLRCSTEEWRINTNPISHRL